VISVGTVIKKFRPISQEKLARKFNVSRELIAAIETGRRRVPQDVSPRIARFIDHSAVYTAFQREASGVGPVYLNNIDDHPLTCVMKMLEEFREVVEKTGEVVPILIKGPKRATDEDRQKLKEWGLECCEAETANENAMGRVFKEYNMSLAEVWDQHQQELIEHQYFIPEKEKTAFKAAK